MVICLLGSCSFGRGLLAIAPVKSIHASRGINQFLLTGEERMAGRANFDVQITFKGGTRLKNLAAGASHRYFVVFRMNSRFHSLLASYRCASCAQVNSS